MQIDPAALSRPDSASTSIPSTKSAVPTTPATQKSTKPLISVPRLDLEPIYTELKAAIGDNWAEYKQSIALFLLGTSKVRWAHATLGIAMLQSVDVVLLSAE